MKKTYKETFAELKKMKADVKKRQEKNLPYIRIDQLDKYAMYQDEKFTGNSKYLKSILQSIRSNVGPADGNTFIAMHDALQKQKDEMHITDISYHVPEEWREQKNQSIIY